MDASLVTSHAIHYQYLAGLLVGLGVGGVVGASTLGVAMFSLIAPVGYLREFTAIVPIVNCIANLTTVFSNLKHAEWSFCLRLWPFVMIGIGAGTLLMPLVEEQYLRRITSVVYGAVFLQSVQSKFSAQFSLFKKSDDDKDGGSLKIERFYRSPAVMIFVSLICGILTVVCNNSGPIFNVYLLGCGLNMDQFVATRSVLMAGKNIAKVVARLIFGGLSKEVILHGIKIGSMTVIGTQLARPIKRRTSPQMYMYFTWCVLLYTCVKMWGFEANPKVVIR
uniref:Membrane transporter protein n=1 Tax=Octactis speculum TaxID=3111310 RepID=A0A7S2GZG8_9STRA|mmetsp:Transcript_59748/g.81678  ORF Transcript_59748/g.81678 Transcript_59748/m.81678 type:complete len:278 (+) Transcript_59748:14-847(+)